MKFFIISSMVLAVCMAAAVANTAESAELKEIKALIAKLETGLESLSFEFKSAVTKITAKCTSSSSFGSLFSDSYVKPGSTSNFNEESIRQEVLNILKGGNNQNNNNFGNFLRSRFPENYQIPIYIQGGAQAQPSASYIPVAQGAYASAPAQVATTYTVQQQAPAVAYQAQPAPVQVQYSAPAPVPAQYAPQVQVPASGSYATAPAAAQYVTSKKK
ncbi:unnamed protein product [Caenorhabditis angaria]|uniref:Uncharacterized protein n=1 Tax=Caenorhabditis angaria TaxID=860376 RepID=A0A9P1I7G2_9PELO|nr:unnamed protein product [Caenorhabditis angaria]